MVTKELLEEALKLLEHEPHYYTIGKTKEELEKILLEEFGHDYWDWIIDDTLKKSILK